MRKRITGLVCLVFTMALFCGLTPAAFAHSASAVSLGGTYVQFSYSDGTLIKGAKIIVQDAEGNTLGAGKTDSNGIYNYADYEGSAFRLIMNDGEGHAVDYDIPEETPPVTDQTPTGDNSAPEEDKNQSAAPTEGETQPDTSAKGGMSTGTIVAVVVVVVAAVVIAVFFSKRKKQK